MNEQKIPGKFGRRCKVIPRIWRMQEVITEMREKGINSVKWIDNEELRRKIKLELQARKT